MSDSPVMNQGQCSKGWSERCAHSTGKRCRCRCGGENHGKAITRAIGDKAPVAPHRSPFHALWDVVATDAESITIRDIGHRSGRSVTNDAEWVVEQMADELKGRRLFYYDSMRQLDEIVIVDGRFAYFKPTWKWASEEAQKAGILQSDAARARPDLAARLVDTLEKRAVR